nr:ionic transporter y4hA [Streptomyces sp. Xyl84]
MPDRSPTAHPRSRTEPPGPATGPGSPHPGGAGATAPAAHRNANPPGLCDDHSMITRLRGLARAWTTAVPVLAVVLLVLTWGRSLPAAVVVLVTVVLAGAVLAAVHHAEVVAHRVGEPFGSLVLAIAVTVIEVALIVTLMLDGGDKSATLARDTVFAAVMITCNGVVGLCLLVGSLRHGTAVFNAEGTGAALATVATLATLSLVLPTFTTSKPGPEFSGVQLTFAALSSLILYGLFVATQTVRHRDYFLPITRQGEVITGDDHAERPSARMAWTSLGLLALALIGVVGLAKGVSPTIEAGVASAGLHHAVVGVIIALLVLLPETIAALRSARRDRVQTSLNLALGSAMASIGLTIPAVALASVWLSGPLVLGLGSTHMLLLLLTVVVSSLTVVPGRATPLQGGVHLVIFAAYLELAINP